MGERRGSVTQLRHTVHRNCDELCGDVLTNGVWEII